MNESWLDTSLVRLAIEHYVWPDVGCLWMTPLSLALLKHLFPSLSEVFL